MAEAQAQITREREATNRKWDQHVKDSQMHISAAEAHHQQVLEIARGEAAQRQLAEERARNREHQVEHLQIRMRKLNEDNEKALAFYKEQASELSREQKQKFINDMNEDHQMELEALRKEMQQAQEEKDQAETLGEKMSFQLHDAKRALNKVEEKLLKQECLMPKLVEINTCLLYTSPSPRDS